MYPKRNRRREPRAPFDEWVEITADGVRRRGSALDLSVGGICIALSATNLSHGGPLVSEFRLPGINLPLELKGVVRWSDSSHSRAGVRFVDLDPGLAELLGSYVAGRLSR